MREKQTYRIKTERLCLRPLQECDYDALYEIYSDPDTVCYIPEEVWTVENGKEAFERRLSFSRKEGCFLYAVELDDSVIGTVSAWKTEMKECWEIGFVFHRSYRHKGYASEAARGLVEMLFEKENVHRIKANLDDRNSASASVCERIGMRLEAHFLQDYWNKGEWTNSYIYAMLKDDLLK